MKWINKIKNWWRHLFKKDSVEEQVEQALNKFATQLFRMAKPVNTYKDAIVIQDTLEGDWGDIWDFSLWESKGIIGWTMIDHWGPFNPEDYEDPEKAYQIYKEAMEKPKIMITNVYEYEDGTYGINMENRTDLWFHDGLWYLV